jgi:LAO/AO transport system kinase
VVNKADRPDADLFVKNLRLMLAPAFHNRYEEVPVIKTVASQGEGVNELLKTAEHLLKHHHSKEKKFWLLAEKAYQLIQRKKMNGIDKEKLKEEIKELSDKNSFQLYSFIKKFN